MNPCEYAIAALHGYGDEDLARSFGNMVKRKIKIKQERIWSIDVTEVEDMMSPVEFSAHLLIHHTPLD